MQPIKSSKSLPTTRESELRDALCLLARGYEAISMTDGVTVAELEAFRRQHEFLTAAAHKRYRRILL